MGFAPVAATSILLIAALLSLNAYHTDNDVAADEVRAARADADAREADKRATQLEIGLVQYAAGPNRLTIDVDNLGGTVIDTQDLEVLIDGVVRTEDITWIRYNNADVRYWHPGQDIEIRMNDITSSPNSIIVVADNGVLDFEVT